MGDHWLSDYVKAILSITDILESDQCQMIILYRQWVHGWRKPGWKRHRGRSTLSPGTRRCADQDASDI